MCPTLKRLMDEELRLLKETQPSQKPEDPAKVKQWEYVLSKIRTLYQGELEEPSWFRV